MDAKNKILVTGATGYVGARLISELLRRGFSVRAMARHAEKLQNRGPQNPNFEIIEANVLDKPSLLRALQGCDYAYYLIHSMSSSSTHFRENDRVAAQNMREAAEKTQLKQILYLGGLGEEDANLSEHLKSRHEVAKILLGSQVPVTVLRAAMIIGSGSASFEILRYLVERLPVMITPKWVNTPCQPIAIRNVIHTLCGMLGRPEAFHQSFDIGGPEVVTYEELMRIYAEEAGLPKRWIIRVPFFTPRLSSYWIHWVTPLSAKIGRPLAEGLKNPVYCKEQRFLQIVPQDLLTPRQAIHFALGKIESNQVESHWSDAGDFSPYEWSQASDPAWAGGTLYKDIRKIKIKASVEKIWDVIRRIGGDTGWYHANILWKFRGVLDRLVGGVGFRRGRRNRQEILVGDALDFWRVVRVDAPHRLRLVAEMKVPGKAILEFEIHPLSDNESELVQNAYFQPKGLWGILYWGAVYPLHHYIFGGMLRAIAQKARED